MEAKDKTIKDFRNHDRDTGSPDVQVVRGERRRNLEAKLTRYQVAVGCEAHRVIREVAHVNAEKCRPAPDIRVAVPECEGTDRARHRATQSR